MKSNLMIKKYHVEYDNGTKSMSTIKSFFGTKLIDIEDNIKVDNSSIQYTETNGYQNYKTNNITTETEIFVDLTKLKNDNHTINPQTQEIFDLENNTRWVLNIDIKKILREYLFASIKKARSFKTIKAENTKDNDINVSIYKFIDINILNRYQLSNIDFYIRYDKITTSNIFNKNLIQYNPTFDESLYNINYITNNFSLIKRDEFENLTNIKILYNQIKKSSEYRFSYYFNVNYNKI